MTINEKVEDVSPVMYVVVSGDHSDYKIVSVWSSKQAALDECELLDGDSDGYDYRVEEWRMNTSSIDGARREVAGYYGVLRPNDVDGVASPTDVVTKRKTFVGEFEGRSFHLHYKGDNNYPSHVSAYSATEEEAVRLVLAKFAEVRGEGVTS